MQVKWINDAVEINKLQQIQDSFCKVTGICAYCLDSEGRALTLMSGTVEQRAMVQKYEDAQIPRAMLERVDKDSIEDQAIEMLEDREGFVSAIAIREKSQIGMFWIAYSVGAPDMDEFRFLMILDLLRDSSGVFMHTSFSRVNAEAESIRSKTAEAEMERNLRTIEATTEIVQLLDSDDAIEAILNKWMNAIVGYLKNDSGLVFQLNKDQENMDILCQWTAPGCPRYFEQNLGLPVETWLKNTKPTIFSSNSALSEGDKLIRERIGVKAIMIFPILLTESGENMVLVLTSRREERNWSVQEVKFTSDAVRIMQNILTKRIQKNSLASSYEALAAILDNVGCSIYVTDKESGERLFANRKLQNTFAVELKENKFNDFLMHGMSLGREQGICEVHHLERNKWYDLTFKEIAWVNGKPAILYSLYDITDKKIYQKKIEQQAYTDFLTGLYNRMCCERDLAKQIDKAKNEKLTGAILYLDLDDFKHINDGLGHQYGDILLKSISSSLQHIKGIENTCYRMGGDEFVIVVAPESYERFDGIVEDIKNIFTRPWYLKDADYYCTMSMGIVTYPDAGDSVPELIKKADIAMYEAKKTGKNRVATYEDGLDSESGRRLDLEKSMRDAAADGYEEFEVYYQPIIDVQGGGKCVGAEALVRWNSTKLGFLQPGDFIPLAEYFGLINPIGNYVLKKACFKCKEWNDAGFDFKINVNLSVVQLLQADVIDIIQNTIKETRVDPHKLVLEVTESLAINDMERMKEILGKIKELGVSIALDDFGTGYSSLNHIREIPLDLIKVDQSFVKELADDAYSQSFVKMMGELAEALNVCICVEGIETQKQYDIVKDMKVKYIQGFYFDRPMRQEEFEAKYLV